MNFETIPPSDAFLESEPSPETLEIMDGYREKRAGILERVLGKRAGVAKKAVSFLPGVDISVLATSAVRGESPVTGKELSGEERMNQAALAGLLTLFYTLHLSGMHKEAWSVKALAATVSTIEFGPEILNHVIDYAREKTPGLANVLESTSEFLQDQQPRLLEAGKYIKEMASNDFISLNLEHAS